MTDRGRLPYADDGQNRPNRWAVIVGVNQYHTKYWGEELQMCVNDAKKLRDILRDRGGYRNDHIKLLTDDEGDPPNRSNIITSLVDHAKQAQPDDLLLFYFSGHGEARSGENYLVTNDAQSVSLTDTALKLSEVVAKMEESVAKQIVIILDACQSGADIGSKGGGLTPEDFLHHVHAKAEGMAILASCKRNEKSWEWQDGVRRHSVFTYFLLNALSGKATLERKEFVTVSDVCKYVKAAVGKWAEGLQTPTLKLEAAGDFILVDFTYGKPADRFSFTKIILGLSGEVMERSTEQARQFVEEIGDGIWLEMVEVRGGRYLMGTPDNAQGDEDERPQRWVNVSSFHLGRYPVTQAQWREVAGWEKVEIELPVDPSGFYESHRPVESVSWAQAVEFCARLSRNTGKRYRLPTEAEWEYACRGWETTAYGIGHNVTPAYVNCLPGPDYEGSPALNETTPVGDYEVANQFGLFDMHGNVWEWLQDWYGLYEQAEQTDPTGPAAGERHVARGGSWREYAGRCRSASRNNLPPDHFADDVGFRVALDMDGGRL